jgi:phosphoglycerate dehydrogenase-like enzyme
VHERREGPFRSIIAMDDRWPSLLFGVQLSTLDGLVRLAAPIWRPDSVPDAEALANVEVLITGWGSPRIGRRELEQMPRLRAVLHAAGSVKGHLDTAVWDRGITVTSAAEANAVPVAEFTLAMILLAGKQVPLLTARYADDGEVDLASWPTIGNYDRRVGVIGASRTGRHVIELLAPFDLDVLVADPIADLSTIANPRARSASLAEVFARCDVVSLHVPLLPSTVGLVTRELLRSMRPDAVLINVARGPVVDERALLEALSEDRISAVLDVTAQEPLPLDHPLRALRNVTLTPHIAGAQGTELRRLGAQVVTELRRLQAGLAPLAPVELDTLDTTA